ncbi:MAG TPA: hypothetical protein VI731_01330 [Bacteroidia bacterium]|nr:hypothetical protein [Bacteroidia bacterium]
MKRCLIIVLSVLIGTAAQAQVKKAPAKAPAPKTWSLVKNSTWTGSHEGKKVWYKFIQRNGSFVLGQSFDNSKWSVTPHQSWHDKSGKLLRLTHDKRVEISENGGAKWTNLTDRSWKAEDGYLYKVDAEGKLWRKKA